MHFQKPTGQSYWLRSHLKTNRKLSMVLNSIDLFISLLSARPIRCYMNHKHLMVHGFWWGHQFQQSRSQNKNMKFLGDSHSESLPQKGIIQSKLNMLRNFIVVYIFRLFRCLKCIIENLFYWKSKNTKSPLNFLSSIALVIVIEQINCCTLYYWQIIGFLYSI